MKYIKAAGMILFSLVFASQLLLAQGSNWYDISKKIVLLQSTREDAHRIIGKPEKAGESFLEYIKTDGGRFTVLYSFGECSIKLEDGKQIAYGWKVPKWTIIKLTFTPLKRISPSKLNISFDDFSSYTVSDVPDAVIYENDKLGVDYTILRGKIENITFRPSEKLYSLGCQ